MSRFGPILYVTAAMALTKPIISGISRILSTVTSEYVSFAHVYDLPIPSWPAWILIMVFVIVTVLELIAWAKEVGLFGGDEEEW